MKPPLISTQAYWQDEIAPAGSDLYYSLLSVDPHRKAIIKALHGLHNEIGSITKLGKPDIAAVKLDWWREEIERLFNGCARHPICQVLSDAVTDYQLPHDEISQFIDAAAMDLDYDAYPAFSQLQLYCQRKGSALSRLQARVLGYQQPQTLTFAHMAGISLVLSQLLDATSDALVAGKIYIPVDEMAKFSVDYDHFLAKQNTSDTIDLFASQAQRARQFWQQAQAHLPDQDRYRQRSLIVLLELQMLLLKELETDGFRLLQHRIMLTPLRKLWLTWRIGWRERRFRNG